MPYKALCAQRGTIFLNILIMSGKILVSSDYMNIEDFSFILNTFIS